MGNIGTKGWPQMKLLAYMKSKNLSDAAMAERIGGGVTSRQVRKWKYGESLPRLPELVRITRVTDREVTAEDFLQQTSAREAAE